MSSVSILSCIICLLGCIIASHGVVASVTYQQYCATINAKEAAGASGFVALEIAQGVATYSFSLDLNNFASSTSCDFSKGLTYHIHSYWKNNHNNSAANSFCGTSYTGGHYDPNFACSKFSQAYSSQCKQLDRISPAYNYTCNSTYYNQGAYARCEVGDTSSKHGIAYPVSSTNLQFSVSNFVDYQPPYIANYNHSDLNSLPWTSFIFHCAQTTNRLVCGKFSTTQLSSCSAYYPAVASSNTDDDKKFTDSDIAVAVVVPSVVLFVVGIAIGYFVLSSKQGALLG